MNLLIFEEPDFIIENEIFVGAQQTKHLQAVLRANIGSTIKLGQLNGKIGVGEIKSFTNNGTIIEIKGIEIKGLAQESVQPEVDLILALPRPQMLKRILENIPTFGVRNLYLINSKRVEKSFFSSPVLKSENIKKHLIIGLEQASVTILPEVEIFDSFRNFATCVLAREKHKWGPKVIAHTTQGGSLSTCMTQFTKLHGGSCCDNDTFPVVAIGPEGGWLDAEVEEFERFGFTRISLGKRILRVETAVYALLAQMQIFLK